jgi:hypothetical protein
VLVEIFEFRLPSLCFGRTALKDFREISMFRPSDLEDDEAMRAKITHRNPMRPQDAWVISVSSTMYFLSSKKAT